MTAEEEDGDQQEVEWLREVGQRLGNYVEVGNIAPRHAQGAMTKVRQALGLTTKRHVALAREAIREGRQEVRDGHPPIGDDPLLAKSVIASLRDEVEARSWASRRDRKRRRLIVAFLDEADGRAQLLQPFSARTWGQHAGCSAANVCTYLPTLVPWIITAVPYVPGKWDANVYLVGCPPKRGNVNRDTSATRVPSGRDEWSSPERDYLYRQDAKWLILSWLRAHPERFKVSEVALAAEVSPSTARAKLKEIADLGFVNRLNRLWWEAVPGDGDPEALAKVDPVGDRRRRRHARERAWFFHDQVLDTETGEVADYFDLCDPVTGRPIPPRGDPFWDRMA